MRVGYWIAIGCWLLQPRVSLGAPTVDIRDHAELDVTLREHVGGVRVVGRLFTRYDKAGIGWARIHITLDGRRRARNTRDDGTFSVDFDVLPSIHDLVVEYRGDVHYGAVRFEKNRVDTSKSNVRLQVEAHPTIASYGTTATIIVTASRRDGVQRKERPAEIDVDVFYGPRPADNLKRIETLSLQATPGQRTARGTLKLEELGEPGPKRIEVQFPGDLDNNAATKTTILDVAVDTTTSILLSADAVDFGDTITVTGKVVDSLGSGLAHMTVDLAAAARDSAIASTTTSQDGSFRIRFQASEVGSDASYNIQAIATSDKPWYRGSRSPVRTITIGKAPTVPTGYTIAAFVATALAVLAFIAARTRPWQRWQKQDKTGPDEDNKPVVTGLVTDPSKRLSSRLRAAADFSFGGVVKDAIRDRPLSQVALTLTSAMQTETKTMTTDSSGAFAWATIPQGAWQVSVYKPGYLRESFDIVTPHRGQFADAKISLLEVRQRIFERYGTVARQHLPKPDLWGVWTPRQIFEYVHDKSTPASALGQLTRFVEMMYFSSRIAEEDSLEQVEVLMSAADEEHTVASNAAPNAI